MMKKNLRTKSRRFFLRGLKQKLVYL